MAIPYASFEELQTRFGVDQLNDRTPRPADFDPETPDYAFVQDFWEALLDEASLEIDLSLRRAGYPAPCVESDGTTIIAGALEQLRTWCIALTLANGQVSSIGEGDPIVAAADRARSGLKDLVRGVTRLDAPLAAATAGVSFRDTTTRFAELGRAVYFHRNVPDRC